MTDHPERARLSRLLFETREIIDLHSDECRSGKRDDWSCRVRNDLDRMIVALAAGQGWSGHSFGGKGGPVTDQPAAPARGNLDRMIIALDVVEQVYQLAEEAVARRRWWRPASGPSLGTLILAERVRRALTDD